MGKKILSVKEPFLSTYCYHGSLLSIIQNSEGYLDWMYSNFTSYRLNSRQVLNYEYSASPTFYSPWTKANNISRKMIKEKWGSIINFIVDSINMDYYLFLKINRYYLECADEYEKENVDHEIFVYGYDDEKRILHIGDNLEKGKYIHTTCSFEEFENAYKHVIKDKIQGVITVEVYENTYKLDKSKLKDKLQEYLNPTGNIFKYSLLPQGTVNFDFRNDICGFNVYQVMIDSLKEDIINGVELLSRREFFLLWEHKKCMNHRMMYLKQRGIVNIQQEVIDCMDKIERVFLIILRLVLKYNILKDKAIIKKIIQYLEDTIPLERIAIMKVMEEL